MKVALILTAVIVLVTAFDFPEEWEAWKMVSRTVHLHARDLISQLLLSLIEIRQDLR